MDAPPSFLQRKHWRHGSFLHWRCPDEDGVECGWIIMDLVLAGGIAGDCNCAGMVALIERAGGGGMVVRIGLPGCTFECRGLAPLGGKLPTGRTYCPDRHAIRSIYSSPEGSTGHRCGPICSNETSRNRHGRGHARWRRASNSSPKDQTRRLTTFSTQWQRR